MSAESGALSTGAEPRLIVGGYVLVYQQIENYVLSPRISAQTMTLNGGVAFGAALAGGAIAGPMGAVIALPTAALVSSFISNYVTSHKVVYQWEQLAPTHPERRGARGGPPKTTHRRVPRLCDAERTVSASRQWL